MTARVHILDRLAAADEAGKGMLLSSSDVGDILEEIAELELMREIDAHLFMAYMNEKRTDTHSHGSNL